MLDKWQALQSFWQSFGLPAYDENTVPQHAELPYITYEAKTANFENVLSLTASIYYRSTSWSEISQKAAEIASAIGYGSKIIPISGGYLRIAQGAPFAQRMSGENDSIRRMIINISCEFLTAD